MKMTYAVFLVRLKNRQVEKRGLKWVVCIKTKQEWDELKKMTVKSQMRAIFNKSPGGIQQDCKGEYRENPCIEKGLRAAYEMALQSRKKVPKRWQKFTVLVMMRIIACTMDPMVWENEVFQGKSEADLSNPPVPNWAADRYANHRSYR